MSRIFTLTLVLFFCAAANLPAKVINEIAAIVNSDVITTYQLDKAMDGQLSPSEKEALSPTGLKDKKHEILQGLIEETLMQQRAKELGLTVSDAEVEEAVKDVEKQNKLTRAQLEQALSAQGIDFADYKDNLRRQIQSFKLLGREVQSKLEVTNQEIRDYFKEHIDDYRGEPFIRLNHITFPIPERASRSQMDRVYAEAQEAKDRLKRGEDFYSVLLSYSADKKAEGGDLGTFGDGELSPAFERAVQGLKEGQSSDIITTPEGFHILFVVERSAGKIQHFDTVKDEISKKVIESKKAQSVKDWMDKLKKDAFIDIKI